MKLVIDYSKPSDNINEMYPEMFKPSKKEIPALTKQQLFDLQFKWEIIPNPYYEGKNKNYLCEPMFWMKVCEYEDLSEDFIREYKEQLDWMMICIYQKLSKEFIWEMRNYLDLDSVFYCQDIDNELEDKLMEYYKSDERKIWINDRFGKKRNL